MLLGACMTENPPISGTQSLRVDILQPTDPGSFANRLPDTVRTVVVNVTALDASGNVDTTYDRDVQVYVQYLGTLTPGIPQDNTSLGSAMPPLARWHLTAGQAMNVQVTLPAVFGPTNVWVDDGYDGAPNFATGVSPTLWYRDPFIFDIRKPIDETSLTTALQTSVLDGKNVRISQSRYGASGRLVVTSTYAQGYTVADSNCQDAQGTPPCIAADYDYLDIYSYHAPTDQFQLPNGQPGQRRYLNEGESIDAFAGGVSEFDGLCEIGFPQTFVYTEQPVVDKAREPEPYVLDCCKDPTTNQPLSCATPDPVTMTAGVNTACHAGDTNCMCVPGSWFTWPIRFKRAESAFVEVDHALVCPLDTNYTQFNQWKLDPTGVGGINCTSQNVINVISAGVIQTDPATLVGTTITKITGNLRSVNIANFHVWIIYPRNANDLVP
jgi:hypothetical protein